MNYSSEIAPDANLLFNQQLYLNNHSVEQLYFFDKKTSPQVCCSFAKTDNEYFVSGIRAPFGGIECSDPVLLRTFVSYMKDTLKKSGAVSVTIRQSPACYQPGTTDSIHEVLIAHGFLLKYSDWNQHLFVDSASFQLRLDDQKKRRLNKIKSLSPRIEIKDTVDSDTWFDLYRRSREHKDFPVTISREEYKKLALKLPGVYQYAGIYLEEKLVANAVFVRVNKDVLYYFLGASDPEHAAVSPSVLLLEAMYEYAQRQHYKMIDLGISSVNGELNEGLHLFKKHIGAMDSRKNTYELIF
ncbi:MAG: GNAT family N-acetyltransferase [Cytophaga sp.]|uniref:GNAT family N-acetyltransferase n=1 Tax=Cytophaga sp. TaxID=29535 RepID=UPI003F7DADFC